MTSPPHPEDRAARTVVHLLRHGEVDNPEGVLYGRLPGYHLSPLGREMAQAASAYLSRRDIALLVTSPLERARETAAPIAAATGLEPLVDGRLVEAGNRFEGRPFHGRQLLDPRRLWWVRNPAVPSWGEPYTRIVARMRAAVHDARDHARGREAVIVSHQLPIWVLRLRVEGRPLPHDPRRRQCSLASVTSLTYRGDRLVALSYAEPAAHVLPGAAHTQGAGA